MYCTVPHPTLLLIVLLYCVRFVFVVVAAAAAAADAFQLYSIESTNKGVN